MKRAENLFIGALLFSTLLAGFLLQKGGVYGLTLFVLIPVLLGALTERIWPHTHLSGAVGAGTLAGVIPLLALFLLGAEGLICMAMAAPLTIPLSILGAVVVNRLRPRGGMPREGVAMLLFLPVVTLGWDLGAKPGI